MIRNLITLIRYPWISSALAPLSLSPAYHRLMSNGTLGYILEGYVCIHTQLCFFFFFFVISIFTDSFIFIQVFAIVNIFFSELLYVCIRLCPHTGFLRRKLQKHFRCLSIRLSRCVLTLLLLLMMMTILSNLLPRTLYQVMPQLE
jgi:hypothetical protein